MSAGKLKITSFINVSTVVSTIHVFIIRDLFETSVSFSIVRHPFERLVSAFQDKIVDQSDGWYANRVQYLKVEYGGVSFPHFAEMILDKSVKVCRQMNTCKLDKHWKPFISRCGYCDIPYTVIARAENIAEDQKYIGHMANVTFHKIGTKLV